MGREILSFIEVLKLGQNSNRSSCWGVCFFNISHLNRSRHSGFRSLDDAPWKVGIKQGRMHIYTSCTYRCREQMWPSHKRTGIRRNLEIYWQTPNKTSIKNYRRRRELKYSTNSEEGHCLWKYYIWGNQKSYPTENSEGRGQVLLTAMFLALKQCLAWSKQIMTIF